ncbi:MAG: hypothetical protein M1371_09840 [Actinobacteria bacterium]|nr:hypothetical protein [Actinomycetota bacterium]
MIPVKLIDESKFKDDTYNAEIVHDSPNFRIVTFYLKAGQGVSPHTVKSEVSMTILKGKGKLIIGDKSYDAEESEIAVCGSMERHGFTATTDMLLLAVIAPRP